ncbi:MAG: hypothetical protein AB7I59_00470 [Geminicoccaceae bacterium]
MTGLLAARPGLSCGLLLAVTLALAVALHRATAGLPMPAEPAADLATEPLPALHLLRFEPPPATDFAELTDRPPFSPTRRPPAPRPVARAEPPPPPPPPAPPSFRLVGVGIPEGGGPGRVLIGREGADAEWLWEGQTIDGWRVVTVEPRRVRLHDDHGDGRDMVLELLIERQGARTPTRGGKAKAPIRPRAARAQPRQAESPAGR